MTEYADEMKKVREKREAQAVTLLKTQDMTQEMVARQVGVSMTTLRKIINRHNLQKFVRREVSRA